MTPLDAVAVPCCGSGTARVKLRASPSASSHHVVIGSCVARPWASARGKAEFGVQAGIELKFGSTVICCVRTTLSPPALIAL